MSKLNLRDAALYLAAALGPCGVILAVSTAAERPVPPIPNQMKIVTGAKGLNGAIADPESGMLMGGSSGGKWIQDKAANARLKGGEAWRIYGLSSTLGSARGTKPRGEGPPCEDTQFLKLSAVGKKFDVTRGGLAMTGSWQAQPRVPQSFSLFQPVYVGIVAGFLRERGIKNPQVYLTRVLSVDLDGDGTREVIISASRHNGKPFDVQNARRQGIVVPALQANSRAGDYSVVLLRKIVNGTARTIPVDGNVYLENKEFNAPTISTIAGVLDANGDGKMEIAVRSRYYEGSWTSLYEINGANKTEVLSAGCGA